MPSDPAFSILLSLSAALSSVPPVCPSSDDTLRQSDTNAHLTSRKAPVPDTGSSDALSDTFSASFHTFQLDTSSPPGGT